MRSSFFSLITVIAVLSLGCAAAPVQEMSDARQAIEAAEAVDADRHAPQVMEQARALLRRAEDGLASRAYKHAQRDAGLARQAAIEARQRALEVKQNLAPPRGNKYVL